MPVSLEFKAKSVDKAVEMASAELNLPKKEIKYEVLSYGSSGIFGLSGTKKAKIRVKLPENITSDILQAQEDKFKGQASHESDVSDLAETTETMRIDDQGVDEKENPEEHQMDSFPADAAESGRLVLQRILDTLTTGAEISVEGNAERLRFNVNGGNAGVLIGKRGQTLDAIQTIVEKVVNKLNEDRIRVLVDIEGYLETRKENLETMAIRLAEKSKKIGKPISLGQMKAYDRRIVHIALKDFPDVLTRSRGEGPLRKLVIFPKKGNYSRR